MKTYYIPFVWSSRALKIARVKGTPYGRDKIKVSNRSAATMFATIVSASKCYETPEEARAGYVNGLSRAIASLRKEADRLEAEALAVPVAPEIVEEGKE